jgi:Thioredoxin-like
MRGFTAALLIAVVLAGTSNAQSDDRSARAAATGARAMDAANEEMGVATPGASRFNPEQDNDAAVDAALEAANANRRHVMIIFGGAWCHDSLALINAFDRPEAQAMLAARYEMVWVDVPVSRGERDIAVARRFGLGPIVGTPTVLILSADGTAINLADAPRWRNAASRKPAAIIRHFERAVHTTARP